MVNLMNRSEQLASLRDIFFAELVCKPEQTFWIDDLVAIGAEIVREFHFDAVTVDDLKHQAFMALGEYTDSYNNHWDGVEWDDTNFVDDPAADACCELRVMGL
jgi:hypothetical protein